MKKLLMLVALALGACDSPAGEFRGSSSLIDSNRPMPLNTYLAAELVAGRKNIEITISSKGGSSFWWRNAASMVMTPGFVKQVTLKEECVSACVLFATTVAARGTVVRLADPNMSIYFHGFGLDHGGRDLEHWSPVNSASPAQIDKALEPWVKIGLPAWVADIEKTLTFSDLRWMTGDEARRAGFVY